MKLRIKGNTLRFRLNQSEVAHLANGAILSDTTEFSPSQRLNWQLESTPAITAIEAAFANATVSVRLPESDVQHWTGAETVGLYGKAGVLEIAVEKDFQCLHRTGAPEEADAFPNPHDCP